MSEQKPSLYPDLGNDHRFKLSYQLIPKLSNNVSALVLNYFHTLSTCFGLQHCFPGTNNGGGISIRIHGIPMSIIRCSTICIVFDPLKDIGGHFQAISMEQLSHLYSRIQGNVFKPDSQVPPLQPRYITLTNSYCVPNLIAESICTELQHFCCFHI